MKLIKEARAAHDWETAQAAKSGLDELLASTEKAPLRTTDPETVYFEELPHDFDEYGEP